MSLKKTKNIRVFFYFVQFANQDKFFKYIQWDLISGHAYADA